MEKRNIHTLHLCWCCWWVWVTPLACWLRSRRVVLQDWSKQLEKTGGLSCLAPTDPPSSASERWARVRWSLTPCFHCIIVSTHLFSGFFCGWIHNYRAGQRWRWCSWKGQCVIWSKYPSKTCPSSMVMIYFNRFIHFGWCRPFKVLVKAGWKYSNSYKPHKYITAHSLTSVNGWWINAVCC